MRARRFLFAVALTAACGPKAAAPAAPAGDPAGTAPPAAAPAAPTAESILDGYVEATGGTAVRERITALRMTGTMSLPKLGITGKLTATSRAPRQALIVADIAGAGRSEQGTDGTVAWEKNAMTGARVFSGDELTRFLRKTTLHSEMYWRDLYTKSELIGEAEWDGQPVWKIEMTTPLGDVETKYYHRDSKLLIGGESVEKNQMGDMPTKETFREYTDYGGLRAPRVIVQTAGGIDIEITIDNVEVNPTLPANTFDVPKDVIPLIKK